MTTICSSPARSPLLSCAARALGSFAANARFFATRTVSRPALRLAFRPKPWSRIFTPSATVWLPTSGLAVRPLTASNWNSTEMPACCANAVSAVLAGCCGTSKSKVSAAHTTGDAAVTKMTSNDATTLSRIAPSLAPTVSSSMTHPHRKTGQERKSSMPVGKRLGGDVSGAAPLPV